MNERELYEAILEKHPSLIKEIRNKTIDEIGIKLCSEIYFGYEVEVRVFEVLEQMKEQKNV